MTSYYFVYILATRKNGTLYVGVTNNLVRRVYEHKNQLVNAFTKKYNVRNLVYFEQYDQVEDALERENGSRSGKDIGKSS